MVLQRGENFQRGENGILHFVFKLSQSSEIGCKVRIYTDEKRTFLKGFLNVSLAIFLKILAF